MGNPLASSTVGDDGGVRLAIVGASLQAVTRNMLADPHLLGISSGGGIWRNFSPFAYWYVYRTPYGSIISFRWRFACNNNRTQRCPAG